LLSSSVQNLVQRKTAMFEAANLGEVRFAFIPRGPFVHVGWVLGQGRDWEFAWWSDAWTGIQAQSNPAGHTICTRMNLFVFAVEGRVSL